MKPDEPPLPQEVLLALRQNGRRAAIELLQQRQGLSAEQAAQRIDRYQEANPPVPLRGPGVVISSKLNALIWLALIAMMVLVYLLLIG
ncbi:hypothetical protein [Pseudomonas zhanjiangensis]|uniref:Ribosomal protein L7/L12 C-terminal domain-containing protein n=1 Tax=Pseudomonas zhanjiangensis TaxID=3239015 RepID=A0ABV3YPG1_9PSED